jgi:AraC-like DNA-binding protein
VPGSITAGFSEPEDFELALRAEGCLSLLITGRGQFRARLTQVSLHALRLSAEEEQLSRIAFIAVPTDMVRISFPTDGGTGPIYGGIRSQPGEIMTIGPGRHVHERTDGPCRWGAIWLPAAELVRYGGALTGAPFAIPLAAQRWRPRPAAARHLRSLHATAIRMAAARPQTLVDPKVAHGFEQELVEAIVECLTPGPGEERTQAGHRQDIVVRFEQMLQTPPERIAAICAVLGVSDRVLRSLCAEHLGMSPTRYDRLRRMSLARRALRRNDYDAANVSEVARRFGFGDLGRFTSNYRAMFGELPSATLRKGQHRQMVAVDRAPDARPK